LICSESVSIIGLAIEQFVDVVLKVKNIAKIGFG